MIEKYLTKIHEATSRPGVYAYRGHDDSKWPLYSGATRRLINQAGLGILQEPNFYRVYISYHRDSLLEPARTQGFGIEGGHIVSDLQLLAKLQHFGAATGLLDFTWDPLIAIWFSCRSNLGNDGKVFVVNTSDTIRLARAPSDESQQTIEDMFTRNENSPGLLYWEPMFTGDAMSRILRQRSVFVIGRPLIPSAPDAVTEITISKDDKRAILDDLRVLDITHISLFRDLFGFSQAESVSWPIHQIRDPHWYLIQGNRFFQREEYLEAVRSYTECTNLVPKVSEPYFLRANAKAAYGKYLDAIDDYSLAIDNKDRLFVGSENVAIEAVQALYLHMIHFNRGNANAEIASREDALNDYTESIYLSPPLNVNSSYFNRGNVHMDSFKLEEAVSDYDEAIALGYGRASYNKGNALVMLGQFKEALECYLLRQQTDDASGASQNINSLQQVLNQVGQRIACCKTPLIETDP